jgi:hypothetical protein
VGAAVHADRGAPKVCRCEENWRRSSNATPDRDEAQLAAETPSVQPSYEPTFRQGWHKPRAEPLRDQLVDPMSAEGQSDLTSSQDERGRRGKPRNGRNTRAPAHVRTRAATLGAAGSGLGLPRSDTDRHLAS